MNAPSPCGGAGARAWALAAAVLAAWVVAVPAAAATACPKTRQLTFDALLARVDLAAGGGSVGQVERICLVGVASRTSGDTPGGLAAVTDTLDAGVVAALAKLNPGMAPAAALAESSTFKALGARLRTGCPPSMAVIPAAQLTPKAAGGCGVLRLPGTPRGLGLQVAGFESGADGYASISADPGAGGWTYGKYQLASSKGGVSGFLSAIACPPGVVGCRMQGYDDLAKALAAAGGLKAAQQHKPAFVEAWTRLSLEDRSMQLAQEIYPVITNWDPMRAYLAKRHGIELASMSCGLREAAFSIRIQHQASSAEEIFDAAIATAGKADSSAIVRAANDYRLAKLGKPGGYYARYGAICSGAAPPEGGATQTYACKYITGVRRRWLTEKAVLAKLGAVDCPGRPARASRPEG